MSDYQHIRVEPISTALGAMIHGVDCKAELPDQVIDEIRSSWLEHLVVFFPEQYLEPAEQLAFARRFGVPVEYPMIQGMEEFPEVVEVVKLPHETHNFGGIWHSDTTYLESPPTGALLLAQELPPVGGDTLFANMYLAYDALSEGMRKILDSLIVVQSSAKAAASTIRFKNMPEAESKPLLDYLFAHQTRPEFTCRFQWTVGSMAMWDNRCTQHNPINDYHGFKRVMHRISIN